MAYLGARKRTTRQASSQAVNRRRSEGGPRAWFASIDWNSVRFRTVAVLFFVVWGALWVRAGYVQLWEGPFLAERARRQHMAAETVAMPRGMITDRNGHILARSVECCSVYANPSIITDIEATATTLAGVLGRPVDQIKPLLEKKRSFVWLARRVDDATAEAIRQADLTGVELSREFERITLTVRWRASCSVSSVWTARGLRALSVRLTSSLAAFPCVRPCGATLRAVNST